MTSGSRDHFSETLTRNLRNHKELSAINYLVLVNPRNPLPPGWENTLLTVKVTNSLGASVTVETKAWQAFDQLRKDLEQNSGIYIELDSAYRSIAEQQDIMARFTKKYGAAYTANTVAAPGYSEHHTGLALDLYFRLKNKNGSFTDIYENEDLIQYPAIWARIHEKLPDYGFILRYPKGREAITGYGYEPWHIRFINDAETAKTIMKQGITLEEIQPQ